MRHHRVEAVLREMKKRRAWHRILRAMLCITALSGVTITFVGVETASATTALTIPAQSANPVPPTGTTLYNPIVWSGGTPNYFVTLTTSSPLLPTGATFSDSSDGCVQETGSGAGNGTVSFTRASIATSGAVATGTYPFGVTATEYTNSNCSSGPTGMMATGTGSLIVEFTPTITTSDPLTAAVGTTIPVTSITSTLASASTNPAVTGTITFTVFGPQATAPNVCTSGGATVGAAAVSSVGSYTPSSGFTPSSVGDYWWYASYNGDSNDSGANSTCGAGMSETIVGQGSPTVTWATPSPITYGTALSASQLDAATTVAGTITYTPAIGTVLSAGTDTLSVVFTPTDTTDYLPSTTTVTLAVNTAALQITASSTTMGYDGSPPSVTASYAGFVNGDNSSSLSVQPSCITSATSSTSVGSHSAANTCSGAVDPNYTMSYVPGNVTVVAPVLTGNFKSFAIKSDRKTTLTLLVLPRRVRAPRRSPTVPVPAYSGISRTRSQLATVRSKRSTSIPLEGASSLPRQEVIRSAPC